MPGTSDTVTRLLHDVREGNKAAIDQLIPLVYPGLHRLADAYLRKERTDQYSSAHRV
ncbi:MAG: ECF-type sigma factor [Bryobacteraceae bacterium]|nr:ECF-type sigma factor [Bryobacteraceae bacterium]